ncbi:MAG: hypothetical protein Q9195_008579 [Heterodermia aff. obscurata]
MGKFGFSKKGEGDDDSIRSSLFSRSKNKSPNPAANPYAQPSGPASAADPYNQAKFDSYNKASSPPAVSGLPAGPKGGNVLANRGGYGDSTSSFGADSKSGGNASQYGGGGYGSDRYGTQNGYGADRYGGPSEGEPRTSRYGPGGYGGLGSTVDTASMEANREALFGSSNKTKDSNTQDPPPYAANTGANSGGSGTYGGGSGAGDYGGGSTYEAYGDRQLTAEEEEEEDVQATKQEIRFIKQSDVASTRNALRAAAMAEETGRNTLGRIGAQGERIHNTEKNLDLTANHNRMAEEKAKELKRLNGSMFAIHPSNPFTAQKRREQRDAEVMERHRLERDEREATRREAYQSDHRMQETFKDLSLTDAQRDAKKKSSLAERAKYQFEADEEDDDMENQIDANLDELSGAASRLNTLAQATGQTLDEQNRHLRRLNEKVYSTLCKLDSLIVDL